MGWEGTMQIPSGYKTITPTQIANAVWALNQGHITAQSLRVYLACFALVAIREAAARSRKKCHKKAYQFSRYQQCELERLTGLGAPAVRRALRLLQRGELLTFAEDQITITKEELSGSETWQKELSCKRSARRPIPFPRSLLRFLAKEQS